MKSPELIKKWLADLSSYTGRSPEEIERDGLLCDDFKNFEIKINFEDGSYVVFRYAFTLQSPAYPGVIAVFTEHNGYHEFPFGEEEELIVH